MGRRCVPPAIGKAPLLNKNRPADAGNSDSKRIAFPPDPQQVSVLLDFHVFSNAKRVAFWCNRSDDPISRSEFYPQPVGVLG
jgi:hypothetical protein